MRTENKFIAYEYNSFVDQSPGTADVRTSQSMVGCLQAMREHINV